MSVEQHSRSGWFGRIVGPAVITAWFVVTLDVILMKQMEMARIDLAYLLILVPALIFVGCGAVALWREGPVTRDIVVGAIVGLYFGGLAYALFGISDPAFEARVARTPASTASGDR